MPSPVHILGVSGSLRKRSLNTAALRAAAELLPASVTIELFDLTPMPMYNQDVFDQGLPEPVLAFRDRIAAVDALLIATPEYNYSVTGALKNAVDWASRPAPDVPLNQKPYALIGVSAGPFGTTRAQLHFRQIAVFLDMLPLNKPQVLINHAATKFDDQGRLTDEATRAQIGQQLEALAAWTRRLRGE